MLTQYIVITTKTVTILSLLLSFADLNSAKIRTNPPRISSKLSTYLAFFFFTRGLILTNGFGFGLDFFFRVIVDGIVIVSVVVTL